MSTGTEQFDINMKIMFHNFKLKLYKLNIYSTAAVGQ